MLKLMKYEFRKQAFSKAIILILIAITQAIFFFGIVTDNEPRYATGVGLLMMLAFGAMFFVAFESIFTYSKDLKTKQSYMLFLTPNTAYSIVGAKVLCAGLQVLLTGIVFVLVWTADASVMLAKNNELDQFVKFVKEFFRVEVNLGDATLAFLMIALSWVSIIALAFFSITLSTTFLANKKGKGFVSFVLFLLINFVLGKITLLVVHVDEFYTSSDLITTIGLTLVYIILTFAGTAYMLDKKVSV